jgi:tRNA A37 threonylcarbamoyladenosine dehydratase
MAAGGAELRDGEFMWADSKQRRSLHELRGAAGAEKMSANGPDGVPVIAHYAQPAEGVADSAPGGRAPDPADRRFGGVARLYGVAGLARFAQARVGVIGLGGVGTWAAEALARSGVGHLRLIDLDHVSESNTNRQIHALETEFGKAKVVAMAERIRLINPQAQIEAIEDFITAGNAPSLLAGLDVVIDCIDQVVAKAALVSQARLAGLQAVTCGGAGGRKDPLRIRRADLARTHGDPLLAALRQRLRQDHGFSRAHGKKVPLFGITAIFSDEVLAWPPGAPPSSDALAAAAPGSPLACGGYGSAVTVTATMGFAAAACALELLQANG